MSESALWVIFIIIFVTVMAVDLFAVDSKETQINTKKAGRLTLIYITIALLFGVLIYFELGSESAASYYAAYAIELSMSVDNLFVFMVIFAAFAIPFQDQHRVLFYGILGAIFLRLLFVEVGADLLETFDWMMYIFGAILIYTAIKTAFSKSEGKKTEDTLSYKLSKKINSTPDLRGAKFLVRENGKMLVSGTLEEIFAGVSLSRPILISVIGDKSIALRILKEERLVTSISLSGDEMRIDFKGSREDETALLKRMIDSGVRVSGFMRERGDLETVFLQLAGKQEERAVMEYEMESGILEGDYR